MYISIYLCGCVRVSCCVFLMSSKWQPLRFGRPLWRLPKERSPERPALCRPSPPGIGRGVVTILLVYCYCKITLFHTNTIGILFEYYWHFLVIIPCHTDIIIPSVGLPQSESYYNNEDNVVVLTVVAVLHYCKNMLCYSTVILIVSLLQKYNIKIIGTITIKWPYMTMLASLGVPDIYVNWI